MHRGLSWRATVAVIPVALGGCLDIGRMTYHFDLATLTGTLELYDIGTDDPTSAAKDFAELVDDYVLGTKIMEDHPTWQVGERHLEERDGVLVGVVQFQFHSAADVGLYQHDKKSAFLWCAKDTDTVIASSGELIPQYPKCVAFDRKSKQMDVTVKTSTALGEAHSLLPEFKGWDGHAVQAPAEDAQSGLAGMFGQALQQLQDKTGGANGKPAFDLGSVLPTATVGADWQALNLPTEGGSVLLSTDRMLEVSHSGTDAAALQSSYGAALEKAGWKADTTSGGSQRWTKGAEVLRLSVVAAGPSVLVVLAK